MERYQNQKELADYTRLLEQTVLNQEKILHQEKMMSLGRLAASMVHEINNPLSGILNYIQLMIRLTENRTGMMPAEPGLKIIWPLSIRKPGAARTWSPGSFSSLENPAFNSDPWISVS